MDESPRQATPSVTCLKSHPRPEVSVIIPSLDGYRNGNVPRLIEQIQKLNFESLEILVVKGVRPNGRARDEGVKMARGQFYIFLDDDVSLGSDQIIPSLIDPLKNRPLAIGMTGASYLLPKDSPAFQQKVARELARIECPIVDQITESDLVCHACLAVSASVYRETGGENRDLVSGTDPDFKARVRARGYKIVVVPHTWVYMPTYENLESLCRKAYQGGRNSLRMRRQYPELVYPSTGALKDSAPSQTSFLRRLFLQAAAFAKNILCGKWLAFSAQFCYLYGWLLEFFFPSNTRERSKLP